jgi:ADP-heptose:LPS heptosyltransferase
MNLTLQQTLFGLSSTLTEYFPRAGARLLDTAIMPIVTHPWLDAGFQRRNRAVLDRTGEPRRVVVLSDIHLGDAVMLQGLVMAVRDFFPAAEIHYVVSRGARPFVEGLPDVSRLWPIYTGSRLPSEHDLAAVRELIAATRCDLIVNACPFFVPGRPLPEENVVLDFVTHAPRILRNETDCAEPNHFLFQSHRFLSDLFIERWPCRRPGDPRGARLVLGDEAVDAADAFVASLQADRDEPWVLLNPDGASPYTRPPEAVLSALLRRLVEAGAFVLIGEGHTDAGVGIRLRGRLPAVFLERTRLVPASLPAPAYAALIDRTDAFVSGDTGPLHWAAAHRMSRTGRRSFWNRTAVFSLFGATPARMSGYDSVQPGFLPAWQNAPSAAFLSHAPCLNVTCVNKLFKTCRSVRCFEGCSPFSIADAVLTHLERSRSVSIPRPVRIPA